MIRDTRPLRAEWSPRDLHHRDGELNHLASSLGPIVDGGDVRPIMITGPPGVGKSTLAVFAVRQLAAQAFDLRWGRVDCLARSSTGPLLNHLLHDANLGADLPLGGTPIGTYYDRLGDVDGPVVTVLDEVTHCEDRSVLATLSDCPGVTPLYITTDDTHLLADVDDRTAERLRSATHIPLAPYSHSALVDILDARAELALVPGSLADGVLEECADEAAGNARQAIALLSTAVRQVASTGRTTVEVADVESAKADAARTIYDRRISDLGTHQRVLFDIIREAERIDAQTLHARYEDRIDSPRVKRTRRRYLAGLESYSLIRSSGSTKNRKYEVVLPQRSPVGLV